MPDQVLGILFHWTGGLASASFYLPYRFVKKWSWETYWLVGGFFSWIIAPTLLAFLLVPHVPSIIAEAWQTAPKTVILAYIFGACWGFGGLTFGLTMRYLGIGLGMAVALSYCAVFGTLVPLFIPDPTKIVELASRAQGHLILIGVLVTVIGIVITGMAGMSKSNELSAEERQAAVKEFNFKKGLLVATFSGIMSACFAFGLTAGGTGDGSIGANALRELTAAHATNVKFWSMFQNLPILIVVLWGGFTTNFVWCMILNIKNRSAHEYFTPSRREVAEMSAMEGVATFDAEHMGEQIGEPGSVLVAKRAVTAVQERVVKVPMATNYIFSAMAGTLWYMQFFFYSMGETKMGSSKYASWTLHMASIILFSSLWGLALKEWKGTSRFTKGLVNAGIMILVIATVIIGYGYFFKTGPEVAADSKKVQIENKQAAITFDATDKLSVLATAAVTLDDDKTEIPLKSVDGVIDQQKESFRWQTQPLSPGKHEAKFVLSDGLGNKTEEKIKIEIPK